MLRTQLSLNSTRQGIQHAVAGTGTNYKIIRDSGNFADIQQQNILTLLFLKYINDDMGNFYIIQGEFLLSESSVPEGCGKYFCIHSAS